MPKISVFSLEYYVLLLNLDYESALGLFLEAGRQT